MPPDLRLVSRAPCIAVNVSGSGEAIIFLHGVGTTKSSWAAQLVHFGDSYFAIAWDARGYGDSDDYDGDLEFATDLAGDLSKVLTALGVETAHIVGLSMGGLVAQCFYFANPRRVATLILANTFPSFRALGDAFVDQFVARRLQPLLDGASPADSADDTVNGLLGPDASDAARHHLRSSLRALRKDSYVKALRGMLAQPAPGHLERITVPTLVLTGEHDRLSPPAIAHDMSARVPGSDLKIIPGCGHLPNIEEPATFNAIVSEFVGRHSGVATRIRNLRT